VPDSRAGHSRAGYDAPELPRVLAYAAIALVAAVWITPARAAIPATWCGGTQEVAQNRVPDLQFAQAQIHVVYAIPSDGADNFAADAPLIVADVAAIDAWWRGQDPTRTPRFDLYAFPGCPPGMGQLDISVFRLANPGSSYLDTSSRTLRLSDEVLGRVDDHVKTLVYYDGPVAESDVCGTSAYVAPMDGARFGGAFVWLQACDPDLGSGGQTARVAAHELIHDLGAEPDLGPPNGCPPPNNGHPCDSPLDILSPFVSGGETLASAVLDVNRDDYYGHSGLWWDVRNSDWLEHLPQFPLTIATSGGKGAVVSSPQGLSCPPDCSVLVDNNAAVSLGAAPAAGFRLVGWSGACSGSGTCRVTMSAAQSVTALFGPGSYRLTVAVSGAGKVSGVGAVCLATCVRSLPGGEQRTLRATPAKGFRFAGWGGDCSGSAACRLPGNRAHHVAVRFVRA
jgi:List-Bact-rpt repeat protein